MTEQRRKDVRLQGFDYKGNALYFITICCANREKLLGEVVDERGMPICGPYAEESSALGRARIELSAAGEACQRVLEASRLATRQIRVGDFVVMPNHVHLVAIAEQGVGKPTPLEDFVRYLKFAITREVHKEYPGVVLWQKGYYEHVIRDDADYERILEYIANNPAQWASDKYFS